MASNLASEAVTSPPTNWCKHANLSEFPVKSFEKISLFNKIEIGEHG